MLMNFNLKDQKMAWLTSRLFRKKAIYQKKNRKKNEEDYNSAFNFFSNPEYAYVILVK